MPIKAIVFSTKSFVNFSVFVDKTQPVKNWISLLLCCLFVDVSGYLTMKICVHFLLGSFREWKYHVLQSSFSSSLILVYCKGQRGKWAQDLGGRVYVGVQGSIHLSMKWVISNEVFTPEVWLPNFFSLIANLITCQWKVQIVLDAGNPSNWE